MRIAFLGTMGIPARYGGFETCVEELATRLARQGHEITVYCGYWGSKPQTENYKGVKLVFVPCLKNKFLDFPFRTLLSMLDVFRRRVDIAHFYGSDSWPYTLITRLMSKKTVVTLDGLPWNRSSYPPLVRRILRKTARFAFYFPNVTIVDSKTVQNWYRANFGRLANYVPYGANVDLSLPDMKILSKKGLRYRKYILFVGRLVREKGVHYLVEAFGKIKTDFDLAIIGGDPYGKEYESVLKKNASANVKFLGYLYGDDYQNLCKCAYVYVTPSDLEGTSPALLTAMALGKCVLVSDIPENLETIGDAGFSFKHGDIENLQAKLQFLLSSPQEIDRVERKAVERIQKYYDWDIITEKMRKIYDAL